MWFDPTFSLSQVVFQTSAAVPQRQTVEIATKLELLTEWAK
jgi:hypothetical protein